MDDTRPLSGATSSTIDAQLGHQPTKEAHTTMTDTHQLSNTVTPTTDAPLTEPSSSDTSSTINAQAQCVLFRLPRELSDDIYEHVFRIGIAEDYIKLENAHNLAPQSDLTITCRRIHMEATAIHQAAFKTYWENDTFSYSLPLAHDLQALTRQCFKHMNCIVQFYKDRTIEEIRRTSDRSSWEMFAHSAMHSAPVRILEGSTLAETWFRLINKSQIETKTLTAPGT
jgi:hypothetical protein